MLGYEAAVALLDCGLVTDEGDVFALTEEKLASSPFFVNKQGGLTVNAIKLLANLEEARQRPLWRILVALSIRHVGPTAARALAAASARSTRSPRHRPEQLVDGRRRRPDDRCARCSDWFAVDWHAAIVDKWRAAGVAAGARGVRPLPSATEAGKAGGDRGRGRWPGLPW